MNSLTLSKCAVTTRGQRSVGGLWRHLLKTITVLVCLETCPLYNYQTFADIFTKVVLNIKAWSVDIESVVGTITI